MNELNTLAQRLRYAMEILPTKKIKGVEVARAVGVKPPSVSDWLSGKSKTMEGENLLKVAKYLDVNPIWLATGKGKIHENKYVQDNFNEEISKKLRSRSPSLSRLIKTLEDLDEKENINEEEIKLLQQTIEILSRNKESMRQDETYKGSIFKEE